MDQYAHVLPFLKKSITIKRFTLHEQTLLWCDFGLAVYILKYYLLYVGIKKPLRCSEIQAFSQC